MIVGLASKLPTTLTNGLVQQGVPRNVAQQVGDLPPVGSLFAAFLGFNPLQELLGPSGVLNTLPHANVATLTGKEFFPHLISGPFHHGLVIVFAAAAIMMFIAAAASLVMPNKALADTENAAMHAAADAANAERETVAVGAGAASANGSAANGSTANGSTADSGTEIPVDGLIGTDVTGLLAMTEAESLPTHLNGDGGVKGQASR
jgi:hypothetical protein